MANLASTGVTVLASWYENGLNNKRHIAKKVSLVLSSMGTATNKVLASAMGLSKIVHCSSFVKSDDTVILPAVPSAAETEILLLGDIAGASDAPADVTGTFIGTVVGY